MATPNDPLDGIQADGATILSVLGSVESAADECAAWLDQATKLRDKAFRISQDRFVKELEAELVGAIDPDTLALQVESAAKLTADYLAESEKMFELMRKQAQKPDAQHQSCGRSIGNTQQHA
jgi:hypothetical protein